MSDNLTERFRRENERIEQMRAYWLLHGSDVVREVPLGSSSDAPGPKPESPRSKLGRANAHSTEVQGQPQELTLEERGGCSEADFAKLSAERRLDIFNRALAKRWAASN